MKIWICAWIARLNLCYELFIIVQCLPMFIFDEVTVEPWTGGRGAGMSRVNGSLSQPTWDINAMSLHDFHHFGMKKEIQRV